MIYPQDEPYHNAKNKGKISFEGYYHTIVKMGDIAKKYFPTKPVGVIFSHSSVKSKKFKVPPKYDWIGFDCYRSIWDCEGRSFVSMYNLLLHHMQPHQRLMAVPETWLEIEEFEGDTDFGDWLKDELREEDITTEGLLRKRLWQYVFCFIYQD